VSGCAVAWFILSVGMGVIPKARTRLYSAPGTGSAARHHPRSAERGTSLGRMRLYSARYITSDVSLKTRSLWGYFC
jgi:hypothetical protein